MAVETVRHGTHVVPPETPLPTGPDLCPDMPDGDCCVAVAATVEEWLLIEAARTGRRVRFQAKKRTGERTGWITGTVASTFWYDGLSARMVEDDPDELVEWTIWPGLGDPVEAIESKEVSDAAPPERVSEAEG